MTCHNLEFVRTRLDSVACGCSSNASFDRLHVKDSSKGLFRSDYRGYKARKLLCCRQDVGRCRVFSTKAPETLLSGTFLRACILCFWFLVFGLCRRNEVSQSANPA